MFVVFVCCDIFCASYDMMTLALHFFFLGWLVVCWHLEVMTAPFPFAILDCLRYALLELLHPSDIFSCNSFTMSVKLGSMMPF